MSTIQKAFVFIVLVLAILAAATNLVLFAQRTNFKKDAEKNASDLKKVKGDLAQAKSDFDKMGSS